jgi:FKBP-type peptidyl-prolyl cis-trans isomerase FklB
MDKLFAIIVATLLVFVSSTVFAASDQTLNTEKDSLSVSIKEKNKQNGVAYLEQNKNKPEVVTLPDGLQYKVVTQGTGPKPMLNDTVVVDYQGSLISGKVFDSSYQRGEPAVFPVSGVIPGWQEALQLMSKGSTWMIYIPAELAYGERGAPGSIGPNETLIFKVHLMDIQK